LDGVIGKIQEIYFDDSTWDVRYFVVDVWRWLLHKNVLLSPVAVGRPDEERRLLPASVTMDQIRHSPQIDTDKPIALQAQERLHMHFGWAFYWAAEALMGTSNTDVFSTMEPVNAGGAPFDPRLRTTRVVTGYEVVARDGIAGKVEDFLLDASTWSIRHLVVHLNGNGLRVALPTLWVRQIRLETARIYVDLSVRTIQSCFPVEGPKEEQEAKEAPAASRLV
jgi:hypothetical protein